MGEQTETPAARHDDTPSVQVPGRRRLTPEELHDQRVAWGKKHGAIMREIKQNHDAKG